MNYNLIPQISHFHMFYEIPFFSSAAIDLSAELIYEVEFIFFVHIILQASGIFVAVPKYLDKNNLFIFRI